MVRGVRGCAMTWLGAVLLALAQSGSAPSVAVFALPARGLDQAVADAVTDSMVDELRTSHAFSRVVGSRELEAALGLEKQRQVLDCTTESCIAQIAGALGVDQLLTGAITRVGESYVLSLRLVDARTGLGVSGLTRRLKGTTEEALLDAVHPAVLELLTQAKLLDHDWREVTTENPPSSRRVPVMGALGGVALVAMAGLPVAALSVVTLQLLPRLVEPPAIGIPYEARFAALYGTTAVLGGMGVAALAVAVAAIGGMAAAAVLL